MPRVCETIPITDENGTVIGHARVQRSVRNRPCSSCGTSIREDRGRLCDFPVTRSKSGTCDRFVCPACAVRVGPEKDLCPPHARTHAKMPPAERKL